MLGVCAQVQLADGSWVPASSSQAQPQQQQTNTAQAAPASSNQQVGRHRAQTLQSYMI